MNDLYVVKYEVAFVENGEEYRPFVRHSAVMSVCDSKEIAKEHIKKVLDEDLEYFKKEGRTVELKDKGNGNGIYYELFEKGVREGEGWIRRYDCLKYELNILDLESLKL